MRILAAITDPAVARCILKCLGLPPGPRREKLEIAPLGLYLTESCYRALAKSPLELTIRLLMFRLG
jgi:hypothetical protein